MMVEALISAVIGFALAAGAMRRWPGRFPQRTLTLATGPVAAAAGAGIAHSALDGGQPVATVLAAAAMAVAMLSLLVRGGKSGTRPVAADFVRM
ncbi:hypothetical protein ACFQLX_16940 [Streptomyces polyrhachis]|uniref:Integral membrane protein n=1 Tax=Streptomyces polyrhachis TaxID=1282885 RepID=A0ABW2GGE2_9ACTN